MLRYPLLVIIPVIVLAVVGYVLAGKKHTTYKAESQVLIGSPSPASQSPAVSSSALWSISQTFRWRLPAA